MKRSLCMLLAVSGFTQWGCGDEARGPTSSSEQSIQAVPSDWKLVQTKCSFDFRGPPELMEIPSQGVDSCVVHFETADCEYTGDYGPYGDQFDGHEQDVGFATSNIDLAGQAARLVRFENSESSRPYDVGLYAPAKKSGGFSSSLSFSAHCDTEEAQRTAERVLRTVVPRARED